MSAAFRSPGESVVAPDTTAAPALADEELLVEGSYTGMLAGNDDKGGKEEIVCGEYDGKLA